MGFIFVLIITTLAIAGSAAFFSIYGLAHIFTGAFLPVVIMATSLEAGKLVAASFVYRYWKTISVMMKTYLISAILVLMLITSAGIFGFLSAAYQQDTLPLKEMESKISLFNDRRAEIEHLKQERIDQRARLDAQIDAIPGNHSTNRRRMRESQKEERAQIDRDLKRYAAELQSVTEEQHKLKTAVIQQEAHTGPIVFIAKAFDYEVDDATKWMIILIIFAFDPLAVILTIGTNIVILQRKQERGDNTNKKVTDTIIFGGEDKSKARGTLVEELPDAPKVEEKWPNGIEQEETDEPEPTVTSVEELMNKAQTPEPHPGRELEEGTHPQTPATNISDVVSSVEHLQAILEDMNSKKELSREERVEKEQIEQLLRRKQVTNRLRNQGQEDKEPKKEKVLGHGKPFKKESR